MRIFDPSSKLRSCHLLKQYLNKELSHKQVLTMMDYVSEESEIRRLKKTISEQKLQISILKDLLKKLTRFFREKSHCKILYQQGL